MIAWYEEKQDFFVPDGEVLNLDWRLIDEFGTFVLIVEVRWKKNFVS